MLGKTIQSRQELVKLLEFNKLLTKSLDLDLVLQTLVTAAKELITVADTIILYLYDQEENVLRLAEGVGVNKEIMRGIAFRPGESLTGLTFSKRKPLLFAQREDLEKGMANMSPENYTIYFQGVYERQVKSAFCVPLIYQESCLGVLVVDNFENEGYFTEHDMSVMEVIADQSSIAIMNSRLVYDLRKKNEQLKNSLDIHKKFTQIIIEGGGIESVLSLLSRTLNHKAYYRATIDGEDNDYLFPIKQGRENYGYIYVNKPIHLFSPIEQIALEHAATALALEIVKQNALYEKELHLREDFFNQLMDDLPPVQLRKMASQLDWDPEGHVQCMIIEGRKEMLWKPESVLEKERFVRSVEKISKRYSPTSFVFSKALQVIIVAPALKDDTMLEIAQAIKETWKTKELLFGLGRKTEISALSDSYKEAKEAIRFGKQRTNDSVISYSKLGAERLWQLIDPTTLDYFVQDKLAGIFSMDTEYFQTLSTYIHCNKNKKATALALHIHPNTLYYRLKRIEEELQISFDNEMDWLNLLLAFQIYVYTTK